MGLILRAYSRVWVILEVASSEKLSIKVAPLQGKFEHGPIWRILGIVSSLGESLEGGRDELGVLLNHRRNRGRSSRLNVQGLRRYKMSDRIPKQIEHMNALVELSDDDCFNNLWMNRDTFNRYCYLLRHYGGLVDGRYVSVGEQVALFLSVLSHHTKVKVDKFSFECSAQTVHRHFHNVLRVVLALHDTLLVTPTPVDEDCTHPRWKYFKGCLGALDGTLIDVTVPEADKARYRTRK
ncbi:hypothetical protein ACS0TY_024527 [Phlomoides rotata]